MNEVRPALSLRQVFSTWWPLAASWALMAIELPIVSAAIARLADPKVHLAALGGIVYPIALVIEAPIIMLLAASTALSRDRSSYLYVRRFMHSAGAVLTVAHVAVAFTPLYDVVVANLLHAPPEIREPGRLGLQLMTPWTWAIAFRRFQHGVLIRFGHSRAVGAGTVVRLVANVTVLIGGLVVGGYSGIAIGVGAIVTGVMCESLWVGVRVRPVLREFLWSAPTAEPALDRLRFVRFYVPLALTPLLHLLMEPIGAAAIGRMPHALDSLAAWPVVVGVLFLTQSAGMAFQEVVVALIARPGSAAALRRFGLILILASSSFLLLLAATPLASAWFEGFVGLDRSLAELARSGLWMGILLPGLTVAHSWWQGRLVHHHRTRGIPESVAIYLVSATAVAIAGVVSARFIGIYVTLIAMSLGATLQACWLWYRHRELDQPAR